MATKFEYEIKYGLVRITNCISDDKEIVIPSKIDGKNVYQLCENSFLCLPVEKLYLPKTIGKIEDSAFSELSNLTYFECHNIDSFDLPFNMDCSNVTVFSYSLKVADKLQSKVESKKYFFKKISYKNDFKYEVIDESAKTAKITKFNIRGKILEFPDEIDGYKIVSIDEIIDKSVYIVKLPKYLESIPDNFLMEQKTLVKIIPSINLKRIGNRAFYNTILKSFKIPKTVNFIGEEAFYFKYSICDEPLYFEKSSFQNINLMSSAFLHRIVFCSKNVHFTFNGSNAFRECELHNLHLTSDNDIIPDETFRGCKLFNLKGFENIRYIGVNAFAVSVFVNKTFLNLENVLEVKSGSFGYSRIKKVFIPKHLKLAPFMFAFSDLRKIVFEKGYTGNIIPEGCFLNTIYLESIRLPKSIKFIGKKAFYDSGIFTINLTNIESVGDLAFFKSNIVNVTFHCLESIGVSVFESCQYVSYVNFAGSSITKIPDNSFYQCKSLIEVKLSKNVKEIGERAFLEDRNLKNINLNRIEKIYRKAFYNSGIQGLFNLPKLYYLGEECFYGCINIISVIFSKKIKVLPYNTFRFCTKLEYLKADGVEVFGMKSLSCTNIKEFVFPKSTVVIEPYTFLYSKIKKCTINQKNGFLNKNIFNLCDYLEEVTINGCKVLSSNSLSELKNLKTVILGDDLVAFKTSAIHSNPYLTSVVIKNDKCVIQGKNFVKCEQLETIYFDNVTEANKLIKRKGNDIKIRKDVADFK